MLAQRWERQALAAMAAGAEVTVDDVLAELGAALTAEPERKSMDPEQWELRKALGVA